MSMSVTYERHEADRSARSSVWQRAAGPSRPFGKRAPLASGSCLSITCFDSTVVLSAAPLAWMAEPCGCLPLQGNPRFPSEPCDWHSGFKSEEWLSLEQELCVEISWCDLGIEGPPLTSLSFVDEAAWVTPFIIGHTDSTLSDPLPSQS